MPTYEYECQKCGHRFELFQSMTDKPRSRCPACRGRVKRLIGKGAGLLFKGSGFYITDYRSKSYHDRHQKESDAPERGAKGGEKPATGGAETPRPARATEPGGAQGSKGAKKKPAP